MISHARESARTYHYKKPPSSCDIQEGRLVDAACRYSTCFIHTQATCLHIANANSILSHSATELLLSKQRLHGPAYLSFEREHLPSIPTQIPHSCRFTCLKIIITRDILIWHPRYEGFVVHTWSMEPTIRSAQAVLPWYTGLGFM